MEEGRSGSASTWPDAEIWRTDRKPSDRPIHGTEALPVTSGTFSCCQLKMSSWPLPADTFGLRARERQIEGGRQEKKD